MRIGHNWYEAMANDPDPTTDPGLPPVYQIRLKGYLCARWTGWFEGMTITLEDTGDTLLAGPVVDQAALHGLLRRVRDLGMPLVSVTPVEPGLPAAGGSGPADVPGVKP